ncbi:hypothetical protein JKP88DRAFT_272905 [Tribonema minus]|uniref:Uncharacterized protein n=1 Tax=Tribonema minus TaxID=303371 RepID=A0A835Z4G9_9STRA|nr:hypothetical protein JKP88DRAFT_272905 [Tribonema minus]
MAKLAVVVAIAVPSGEADAYTLVTVGEARRKCVVDELVYARKSPTYIALVVTSAHAGNVVTVTGPVNATAAMDDVETSSVGV